MANPTVNSRGLPVTEFTEEQRYLFDTRGWLLIPAVLKESELSGMREFCTALKTDGDSLSEKDASPSSTATTPSMPGITTGTLNRLRLAADDGGDGNAYDAANWANPQLHL